MFHPFQIETKVNARIRQMCALIRSPFVSAGFLPGQSTAPGGESSPHCRAPYSNAQRPPKRDLSTCGKPCLGDVLQGNRPLPAQVAGELAGHGGRIAEGAGWLRWLAPTNSFHRVRVDAAFGCPPRQRDKGAAVPSRAATHSPASGPVPENVCALKTRTDVSRPVETRRWPFGAAGLSLGAA